MSITKRKSQVEQLSEEAWNEVQNLIASLGNFSPPAPIGTIAESFGVRRIRFEALWGNAGLRKIGDEFEIVVNTESPGVNQKAGEVLETHSGLSDLQPSLRFTIAHEIAHLVFLRLAGGDSNRDLFLKNAQAVENACNILARILLMPKQSVLRELKEGLLNIERVQNFLAALKVSAEAFFLRIRLSDVRSEFKALDGLLALVEKADGLFRIKICHVLGPHALDRFDRGLPVHEVERKVPSSLAGSYRQAKWRIEGRSLKELALGIDADALLGAKTSGASHLNVSWRPEAKQVLPCDFAFQFIQHTPPTFLVGITVTGELRDVAQETLI